MIAQPEDVIEICQRFGIEVSHSSNRLRFKVCPSCGQDKWKLWLFDATLAGSCFRCRATFSIRKLLKDYGVPLSEIASIVKINYSESAFALLDLTPELVETKIKPVLADLPRNRYFQISEWPTHPVSLYALSRGVPEDLFDLILIDVVANAVVFLVYEYGKLIGMQSRYLNPVNKNMKTYTAKEFKTGECLLIYPREEGDIVLCEGPFNAVSAYCWGHTGVCFFGSKVSKYQVDKLCELHQQTSKKIYCAFDMDDAGWHGYLQVRDLCGLRGVEVLQVVPDYGNDLNESWIKGGKYTIATQGREATSLLQYLPDL
jgi:hypothetical protein